jgi:lysophospholipase L1-like esterase
MIKKFFALSLSCLLPIGSPLLANAESSASEKIKVACVGDSITFGAGIADRENASYPAQLQKLLGDDFEVRNFGHGGRTLLNAGDAPYIKSPKFEEALNFAPDVVVIMLGTNDSMSHNWRHKNNFIAEYQRLITLFRQLPSQPVVWICKPVPAFLEGASINGIIAHEIPPRIDFISQESGAPVIDLHTPLLAFPQHFPDKVHPNAGGAGEIATIVAGVLSKYRDQAPPTAGLITRRTGSSVE